VLEVAELAEELFEAGGLFADDEGEGGGRLVGGLLARWALWRRCLADVDTSPDLGAGEAPRADTAPDGALVDAEGGGCMVGADPCAGFDLGAGDGGVNVGVEAHGAMLAGRREVSSFSASGGRSREGGLSGVSTFEVGFGCGGGQGGRVECAGRLGTGRRVDVSTGASVGQGAKSSVCSRRCLTAPDDAGRCLTAPDTGRRTRFGRSVYDLGCKMIASCVQSEHDDDDNEGGQGEASGDLPAGVD